MSESRPDHLTWRHRVVIGLMAVVLIALAVRLVQVQVLDHEDYLVQAMRTRLGAVDVPAPRGAILDATGYPLATSIDTFDVYLDRFLWRDRGKAFQAAAELAPLIDANVEGLMAAGTEYDSGDALVRRDIDYSLGERIRAAEIWGVHLVPSSVRVYPEGNIAGQIVGYVGRDHEGLWGIEADYDNVLRGKPGWVSTERDPLGRPIAFGPRSERAPAPGGEVQLTIDRFVQAIAEQRLEDALEQYEARSGSIVVMNPQTGAILAMASRPSVSLSDLDLNNPELSELVRNRVVTDLYEPGSVFKTLTTAAAIDLGEVTADTTYEDTGAVEVGNYVIRNWDYASHGVVDVRTYLQKSLNTGSVWLAEEIGASTFYDYMKRFGMSEPTHVGLAGEAEGLMRTPDDPNWYPVDLATNSYGQGLAVTPLQMLTAVNTFATDGMLMRPYVVSKVVTGDHVRNFEPVEVRQVVSPATARSMLALMRDVVEGVQYHGARVPGYTVAGKTGTTLVSIPTGYDLDTTIASFAGFIPYESPVVSILVKIDQPSGGLNLGGQVAAPVFAKVALDIMNYLNVEPTKTAPSQVTRP